MNRTGSLASSLRNRSVYVCLLAFLGLRLGFWLNTFPNPDEAYYWLWGQHPGWSYYDHPPFAAWVQGVFTAICGRSRFVLRLPNLISNGTFFLVYFKITSYLYGKEADRYFWIVVLLVLASPLYFLFLALAWPDHFLIVTSLVAAYLFIRFLDSYLEDTRGESWRLYGAAGAIALALLCKYNAVFVLLGLIATVMVDKRLRPLWRDRRTYLAGAIICSALIPILIWNVSNDFQSFRYYAERSVNSGNFSLKIGPCLNFLLFSFLLVSPFNWVGFWRGRKQVERLILPHSTYRAVAFWVFIVSTSVLTVISMLSAALYYWNITAYLLLFPLLPAAFLKGESREEVKGKGRRQEELEHAEGTNLLPVQPLTPNSLFWYGQFYGLLFATLLVVHYSILPISALFSKTEDPDSRMLFGWDGVATIVQSEAAELGDQPFLVTTDYRSASALAFQLNDRSVMAISDRVDQFDFWYTHDQEFKDRNAVILADDWHPLPPELLAQFQQTSASTTVPVTRFGVWIKNYYVVKGFKFKGGRVS